MAVTNKVRRINTVHENDACGTNVVCGGNSRYGDKGSPVSHTPVSGRMAKKMRRKRPNMLFLMSEAMFVNNILRCGSVSCDTMPTTAYLIYSVIAGSLWKKSSNLHYIYMYELPLKKTTCL